MVNVSKYFLRPFSVILKWCLCDHFAGTVVTKRSLLEPPIPGWTGFVPRARVTELGHGVRYHEMAKHCYQDFKDLIDRVHYDPASNLHE